MVRTIAEDRLTVTRLARVYFAEIRAPQKQFVVLPNVGHLAIFTARDAFFRVLVARVLPVALANQYQRQKQSFAGSN